jgi:hypothetical protein
MRAHRFGESAWATRVRNSGLRVHSTPECVAVELPEECGDGPARNEDVNPIVLAAGLWLSLPELIEADGGSR